MSRETSRVEACPRCGSEWVTRGAIGTEMTAFHPAGMRMLALSGRSVALRSDHAMGRGAGLACLSCGLVWSEVDPLHLRQVILRAGTDRTREWMMRNEPGEDPS